MELYVQCKNENCKREFVSPIQVEKATFPSSALEECEYQCPYCRQSNIYNKNDYFFK